MLISTLRDVKPDDHGKLVRLDASEIYPSDLTDVTSEAAVLLLDRLGTLGPEEVEAFVNAAAAAQIPLGIVSSAPGAHGPRVREISDTPPEIEDASLQVAFAHADFRSYLGGAKQNTVGPDVGGYDAEFLIAQPVDCLYLLGHSNGHDAGIGPIVLCRQPDTPRSRRPRLDAYPCFNGHGCRFKDQPVRPVTSRHVNARRIVNLTCWGSSLSSAPFSPTLSVGAGLLAGARLRVMLTLFRASRLSAREAMLIYYLLNSGVSFGRVANVLNDDRCARGQAVAFACFGDPRERLAASVVSIEARVVTSRLRSISLPARDLPYDFVIELSDLSEIPGVCVTHPMVTAGSVLSNRVWLSVAPGPETVIMLEIVEACEIAAAKTGVNVDLQHLSWIKRFCSRIKKMYKLNALTQDLRDNADEYSSYLEALPHRHFQLGAFTDRRFLEAQRSAGCGLVDEFMVSASSLHERLASFGAMSSMRILYDVSDIGLETRHHERCPICRGAINVTQLRLAGGGPKRSQFNCDCCGPIQQSASNLLFTLCLDGKLIPGTTIHLSAVVPGSACQPWTRRAQLSVVLCTFLRETDVAGRSEPVDVNGSDTTLSVSLALPERLTPGVYYLSAQIIVGAEVSHVRHPVSVG